MTSIHPHLTKNKGIAAYFASLNLGCRHGPSVALMTEAPRLVCGLEVSPLPAEDK
jgi:hypothetical protein